MISESRFTEQLKEIGLIPNTPNTQSTLKVSVKDTGKKLPPGKLINSDLINKWALTLIAENAIKGISGTNTKGYPDYRGIEVVGS